MNLRHSSTRQKPRNARRNFGVSSTMFRWEVRQDWIRRVSTLRYRAKNPTISQDRQFALAKTPLLAGFFRILETRLTVKFRSGTPRKILPSGLPSKNVAWGR